MRCIRVRTFLCAFLHPLGVHPHDARPTAFGRDSRTGAPGDLSDVVRRRDFEVHVLYGDRKQKRDLDAVGVEHQKAGHEQHTDKHEYGPRAGGGGGRRR